MSTLPDFRRIQKQDLPGSPDWVNNLLSPINLFFEQVTALLNGNVDFTNLRGNQITTTFSTPSNYSDGQNVNFSAFTFPIKFSGATNVIVGSVDVKGAGTNKVTSKAVTIPVGGWQESSAGQITISYITGLQPNTSYTVSFLVF